MNESFRTELPPVAADIPIVAELIAAAQRNPEPAITDIVAVRADNPRRLGQPWIRRPVEGTSAQPVRAGGISGEWIAVPGGSDRPVFLYFHGGAYVRGSLMQGRGIASALASLAHGRTFAVEYGLAPERPFPAPLEDGRAAYRYLLSLGIDPHDIVLAGDSCGGAIVVATMLAIRDANVPMPAAGISFSPWADMTHSGESYTRNVHTDLASREFSFSASPLYVGSADPRDPLVSPVFADLTGLPPLQVVVGSEELLYSDSLALAQAAHRSGVDVTLHAYTGMPHVFPMLNLATGDRALAAGAAFALRRTERVSS